MFSMAKWLGVPASEYHRWKIVPNDLTGRFAYYRCDLTLPEKASLSIDISANSRYRLWINDRPVLSGPCKGDKERHFFETVDVSEYLVPGKNVFAAAVLYCEAESVIYQEDERAGIYGVRTPSGGHRLAVEGDCLDSEGRYAGSVTTGKADWRVYLDGSFYLKSQEVTKYLGAVCYDVDFGKMPVHWKEESFRADAWEQAVCLEPVMHDASDIFMIKVGLVKRFPVRERPIPLLYEERGSFVKEMTSTAYPGYGLLEHPVLVPSGARAQLILDAGKVTNAYPRFRFEGGKNATVRITYFEKFISEKGVIPRDDIENGTAEGLTDHLILDGSEVSFEPFWFRTFRFVKIDVQSEGEDTLLYAPEFLRTGYPLKIETTIHSPEKWVEDVWQMCVHTLKNCMMETYMDCPYYEQLQFVMDTRLQALFNYAVSTDVRLAEKALEDFHYSMTGDGLTQGKYPSAYKQMISTFSLYYIFMLQEYYWQTGNLKTIRPYFPDIDRILDHFDRCIGAEGLVEHVPYWNFVDWHEKWADTAGAPAAAASGPSTIVNFMYAYALKCGADLSAARGRTGIAEEYLERQKEILQALDRLTFSEERNMYREGPAFEQYSQHAQAWAVLNGVRDEDTRKAIMKAALTEPDVLEVSFSTSYEWFRALEQCGMYAETRKDMEKWAALVEMGCTACPETPGVSRSDCHAWSALPMYEMVRVMAGISPAEPGWEKVRVCPAPTYVQDLSGQIVTPKGIISFCYRQTKDGWDYQIDLPDLLKGRVVR